MNDAGEDKLITGPAVIAFGNILDRNRSNGNPEITLLLGGRFSWG